MKSSGSSGVEFIVLEIDSPTLTKNLLNSSAVLFGVKTKIINCEAIQSFFQNVS
jgi:hypothetical protein